MYVYIYIHMHAYTYMYINICVCADAYPSESTGPRTCRGAPISRTTSLEPPPGFSVQCLGCRIQG